MNYTIAIDLGGTIIKTGLLQDGKLIARSDFPAQTGQGLRSQLPELKSTIDRLLAENGVKVDKLAGIAFAFAGLVDSDRNKIISTNQKYDDGPETDLVSWAKNNFNCPLFAENDARMALLGEWQYGAGSGYSDMVMITLGTGIGTAVIIDGKLLKGKHFQAGNLGGHLTINHQGSLCTCGNIGCMEAEASTWRLPDLIRSHKQFETSLLKRENNLDFESLFRSYSAKDPVALDIMEHCFSVWSAGIISLIHAYDPEIVILGGGIMKSASLIIPELQKRVDKYAWTPWGKVQMLEAHYKDEAALYGGDYLVRSGIC